MNDVPYILQYRTKRGLSDRLGKDASECHSSNDHSPGVVRNYARCFHSNPSIRVLLRTRLAANPHTVNPLKMQASSMFGTRLVVAPAAPRSVASTGTRQVTTCMAKKKGVRVVITIECTEARKEGETPSRYTTEKVGAYLLAPRNPSLLLVLRYTYFFEVIQIMWASVGTLDLRVSIVQALAAYFKTSSGNILQNEFQSDGCV